jgi:hypothetical protein
MAPQEFIMPAMAPAVAVTAFTDDATSCSHLIGAFPTTGAAQRFVDAQMYNAESIAFDTAPELSSTQAPEAVVRSVDASKTATRIISQVVP